MWELYWLAATHPELFEKALALEWTALTGRHSRVDHVEFGAPWEEFIRTGTRFPSTTTTVGLGRSFSWNQWALMNGVVGADFKVVMDSASLMALSSACRQSDNALDGRDFAESTVKRVIPLHQEQFSFSGAAG